MSLLSYLNAKRDSLQLCAHLIEFLNIPVQPSQSVESAPKLQREVRHEPSGPNEILSLDLARSDLAILGALLDILHQLLLLVLQLHTLSIQLALGSVQGTLVFAQTLRRRHALAERPFDDL